jgi:hypothetical protein
LTWPYHWSLFFSMMSIMSGFSFTPIISFICSFFTLSILHLDFVLYINLPKFCSSVILVPAYNIVITHHQHSHLSCFIKTAMIFTVAPCMLFRLFL